MTGDESLAVRRELDQLAGWLTRLEQRVDSIDSTGTRGMAAVQVQITDMAKDMGELRGEQRQWQDTHEKQHQSDQAQRASGRRWLITVGLTNAVAVGGPLLALLLSRR